VLIRIRKTAICGTDMHIFNWDEWAQKTIPVPMHVGHEYVGTVKPWVTRFADSSLDSAFPAKATSSADIAATAARVAGTSAATPLASA
jgi:NADPH:quinone reductase-like Zn-dependent oxidoreductase